MNQVTPPPSIYRYLPVAIFIGFAVMMSTCFMLVFASRSGHDVSRASAPVSGLPEDATNVSYYIPGLMGKGIYIDFKTSESGFVEWMESHENIDLQKQAMTAFTVQKYNHREKRPQNVVIEDGLLYSWSDEGKGVYLAYDRKTSFAYFHSKSD